MRPFALALIILPLLSACSFQSALDNMVKPERQREIVDIAQRICSAPDSVKGELHPEIATTIDQAKPVLPRECPGEGATWQLASYNWRSNVTTDISERQEEVVVVGNKAGKWSTIELRFYARNDEPLKITLWHILASDKRPPALEFIDGYNRTVNVARIAIPIVLILIAGLVVWLVRRQRAKRAA